MTAFLSRSYWLFPIVLACAGALVPSFAVSEVTVRSGEHPGHSRLVLQFDEQPNWRLEPASGQLVIYFDPAPGPVDIEEVFYFIPRTRIADLRPAADGSKIEVDLACDCKFDFYEARNRALVLDVHDPESASETRSDEIPRPTISAQLLMANLDEPAPDLPAAVSGAPYPLNPPTSIQAPALPLRPRRQEDPSVGIGLTRALAEELARAAAQGLIDANPALSRTKPQPGAIAEHSTSPALSSAQAAGNIRIRTGIDSALGSRAGAIQALPGVQNCPDPSDFEVASWGTEEPPARQIARLRQSLVGEFDRVEPAVALSLVKLYIYLSFDAESQSVLEGFLPNHPRRPELAALAGLIGTATEDRHIAQLGDCGGSLPLWALLAGPATAAVTPLRKDSVLLAFSALPGHLRRHLAAPLAARFSEVGEYGAVQVIVASVDLVAKSDEPGLVLARARSVASGKLEPRATAALDELATSLRPEAAEALLLNVEGRLARGDRIPQDLVDAAAIMAFEFAGTPEGERLKVAEVTALFANGGFAEGFRVLEDAESFGRVAPDLAAEVWRTGLRQLHERAENADFARLMFAEKVSRHVREADRDLRRDLSERLLELGFASKARMVLGENAETEERQLSARIALAEDDPDRALSLAAGAVDPALNLILAEALVASGRHEDAADAFRRLGDDARSLDEAWRAGQWDVVAATGAAERKAAATAMLSTDDHSIALASRADPTPPTLAEAGTIVDDSSALRALLTSLLGSLPEPDL